MLAFPALLLFSCGPLAECWQLENRSLDILVGAKTFGRDMWQRSCTVLFLLFLVKWTGSLTIASQETKFLLWCLAICSTHIIKKLHGVRGLPIFGEPTFYQRHDCPV